MNSKQKRYRIIIVGAGFSVHAGLPLGNALLRLVRDKILRGNGLDNKFESDINRYKLYKEKCTGISISDQDLDYEQFMSFIDMEHFLGLKGKDTWSSEGNESQLMIRCGILNVLHELMPSTPTKECIKFCSNLTESDTIITFNYDTLIEDTLDYLGIKYRLFPCRYSAIGVLSSTVDSKADKGEIVIYKLHGSIDWFDKTAYIEDRKLARQTKFPWNSHHPIFSAGSKIKYEPLTQGPRPDGDMLSNIYRVRDLEKIVNQQFWKCSPLILSPSSAKILYANPIKSLWHGLQTAGALNLGLGVIGYSLPDHDEYAKQVIYHIFRNYTEFEPNLRLGNIKKKSAKIIDFAPKGDSEWRVRKNYSFVNWRRCKLSLDGLCDKSIEWFFHK